MKSEKRKAKLKKQKKYLSIMFIPHSQDRVKVIKISAFYPKAALLAVILISLVIALFALNLNITQQRDSLKKDVSNLSSINAKQKNTLNKKTKEIDTLQEREESINDKIHQVTEKYKELAEKYLSGDTGSKTSRSGDRTERTFVDDISGLKSTLDELKDLYNSQDKDMNSLSETEDKLQKYMASIPTKWPAEGNLSSHFGGRDDPFNSTERFHAGIDIAADYGSDILAAADGIVIKADWYSGYGRAIVLSHGHGLTTVYGHTSEIVVKEGQKVKKGQLIGRVGSTGRSTGPHLHFEVRKNDTPVNPLNFLDKNKD
ncbi:MAG: peptidoglycan DD-metalloendopeptidase family protein [Bacillota bacterium]|nr:peptidoglycan DD-metalloendopeptidase family protein [Bacillota bacterium]